MLLFLVESELFFVIGFNLKSLPLVSVIGLVVFYQTIIWNCSMLLFAFVESSQETGEFYQNN